MAMLGRFRRRMAAASLSALINGGALSPSTLDPKSIASLAALMIKARRRGGRGRPMAAAGHPSRPRPVAGARPLRRPLLPTPASAPSPPLPPTKVVREVAEFKSDVAHLDGMDFAGELGSDYVLAARVNLSK
jgi:hypothetical protein